MITKSTGDWRKDQAAGYVAHVNPDDGTIDGPEDAFIFFGLPFEGNPWRDTRFSERTQKDVEVEAFVDKTKLTAQFAGVAVEWVEWDLTTGCNVYRRTGELVEYEAPKAKAKAGHK